MPRRYSSHTTRRTVTLHADWWSPEQDETGQWKERVVIYRALLAPEHDAAEDRQMEMLSGVSPAELAGLDAEALKRGDVRPVQELLGGGMDLLSMLRQVRGDVLLWLVEVTDDEGNVVLARDPQTGELPPDSRAILAEFEGPDLGFIRQAIQQQQQAGVIPVTPQDEEKALAQGQLVANGRIKPEEAKTAAQIAEDSFRPDC